MADSFGYLSGLRVATNTVSDGTDQKSNVLKVQPVDANGAAVSSGTNAAPTVVTDGGYNKTDRSVTAGTTSAQAAPANATRKRLFIQNLDAAINVHINLGAAATTGVGSVRISPGASLELTGTSQTVNVIAASGTPLVTIWEF